MCTFISKISHFFLYYHKILHFSRNRLMRNFRSLFCKKNFASFSLSFAKLIFAKKWVILQKSWQNTKEHFCIFSRKFLFARNPNFNKSNLVFLIEIWQADDLALLELISKFGKYIWYNIYCKYNVSKKGDFCTFDEGWNKNYSQILKFSKAKI